MMLDMITFAILWVGILNLPRIVRLIRWGFSFLFKDMAWCAFGFHRWNEWRHDGRYIRQYKADIRLCTITGCRARQERSYV